MTVPSGPVMHDVRLDTVEVAIPASPELVSVVRYAASVVASRAGFDVEELEDLRLAVDELCVAFVPLDVASTLRVTFERDDTTIWVTCSFESPTPGRWLEGSELSRQVLDALVDEHERRYPPSGPCAWLRKRRATAR